MVNGASVSIDKATGATTYFSLNGAIVPGSGNVVNGIHINGLNGTSNQLFSSPFLVAAPRLGLAWDATGGGKTAIRASAGTLYNRQGWYSVIGNVLGNASVVYTPSMSYGYISQIPHAAAAAALSPTATSIYPRELQPTRSLQPNFTIQRDVGRNTVVDAGYVGNIVRHSPQMLQLNPVSEFAYANPANVFSNTEVAANLLRTNFPGLGSVTELSDSLSGLNYHALQVGAQHSRGRGGFHYGVAYTFSKALGVDTGIQPAAFDDPYNKTSWYYGPLSQDRTQNLSVNYSYPAPQIAKLGFVGKQILGNWTVAGIAHFHTGAPVTPTCSSISPGVDNSDPSLSGITARCQVIANPKDFQPG
jgi:hypothetical protein